VIIDLWEETYLGVLKAAYGCKGLKGAYGQNQYIIP
jgi:hypothetical protein